MTGLYINTCVASADDTPATADTVKIYQGTHIRLDLFNPIAQPILSKGLNQGYEMAVNVRLKDRFYPTLELGYACSGQHPDSLYYFGQGGFARVGLDINGLKRHKERLDALLIGVRIGTSLQDYYIDKDRLFRADCWGEVVAGCQVRIAKGFMMGWAIRMQFLMTETQKEGQPHVPYYIPGFGEREAMSWGGNYYIGYFF